MLALSFCPFRQHIISDSRRFSTYGCYPLSHSLVYLSVHNGLINLSETFGGLSRRLIYFRVNSNCTIQKAEKSFSTMILKKLYKFVGFKVWGWTVKIVFKSNCNLNFIQFFYKHHFDNPQQTTATNDFYKRKSLFSISVFQFTCE